jgi:hypothetical protein
MTSSFVDDPRAAQAPDTLMDQVLREAPLVHEACVAQLHRAQAPGDGVGAWRAATAGLLHTLCTFTDFRHWRELLAAFDRFEALRAADGWHLSAVDGLRADAVHLNLPGLDHTRSFEDPALRARRQRVFEAVRSGTGLQPDERVMLAKLLVDHDGMRNDLARVEHLQVLLNDIVRAPGVSPLWQGRWWTLVMANAEYWGQIVLAREALGLAQALLEQHDLPELALAVARQDMQLALRADDMARGQRAWHAIERLRAHLRPALLLQGLRAQAAWQLRRGEYAAAMERTALILALCDDHEVPERDRAGYIELRSVACTGLGRHDEALAILEGLAPTQHGGQHDVLQALIALARAVKALDAHPPDREAQALALEAVRRCETLGYTRFLNSFPGWAARVAAIALDAGVAAEFVEAAVRERALPPPEPWRERWPWRLRVHVLGGLQVWRDGVLLTGLGAPPPGRTGASRRPQRRPLELLAWLAAHPGGVPAETLMDTLWPSLDAEAPKASLEMAVTRLRKSLDFPEAVRVADGRISLHPGWVFSDVAGFEAAAAAGQALPALQLYRGPLLAGERLSPGLQQTRERLAARLAGVVLDTLRDLRAQGQAADAAALQARALAAEPSLARLLEPGA